MEDEPSEQPVAVRVSSFCYVTVQGWGSRHPTQHAAFRRLMCRISAPSSRSHGNQTQHHYWYFPYDHAISPLPRERSHVATEGLQARGQAALRGALEQSEQQISGSASGKPDVVVGMA